MRDDRKDSWFAIEGSAFPLGATWIPGQEAYNFALYSKHATAVSLLLFREEDSSNPALVIRLDHASNKSGRIWHCRVPRAELRGATLYAYSVDGPKTGDAFDTHAFDADKILLDPYAKEVFFPAELRPGSSETRGVEYGPGTAGHSV